MSVPNRAEHGNRKMGDYSSPHNGEYRLQMSDTSHPDTYHPTPDSAHKMADYKSTKTGHGKDFRVYKGDNLHSGGRGDAKMSETQTKGYEEHLNNMERIKKVREGRAAR